MCNKIITLFIQGDELPQMDAELTDDLASTITPAMYYI